MLSDKKSLTVCLVPLGCAKSLVDSEKILGELASGGCLVAAPIDDADVIVINTCGFLAAAREEALEVIAEALQHKRSGRTKRVIVSGCLPSRDGESLYGQAGEIDAVIGVNNRRDILRAVLADERVTLLDPVAPQPAASAALDDRGRFRLTAAHTAYLRIAEGCSQGCTYCTIPAIRGPFRSKQPQTVLAEAAELIADGAAELNIIAQDTTSFGRDLAPRTSLATMLRSLNELDGVEWIRLLYTYPRRFTDELIDAIAECRHVVPYVDIPLQHIADGVLKRMGRAVGRKDVEALLDKLRVRIPGLVLRTTFIVGFPGETEAQFDQLLQFVEDFEFDALGVFEFSPEDGTPAAEMSDQVPDDVKRHRAERIMLAQQQIALAINESVVDSPITVLVDGADEQGRCVGRYYGQAPEIDSLCILTAPAPAGSFVDATVLGYDGYDLIVEPCR